MEKKTTDGGFAFPQHGWAMDKRVQEQMQDRQGMTLRDYFAAEVISVVIMFDRKARTPDDQLNVKEAAKSAYIIADAMLVERAERSQRDELESKREENADED